MSFVVRAYMATALNLNVVCKALRMNRKAIDIMIGGYGDLRSTCCRNLIFMSRVFRRISRRSSVQTKGAIPQLEAEAVFAHCSKEAV